jgi:hypothetical protein
VKNILLLLFCCFCTLAVWGQKPPPEYTALVKKADSLYKAKDYRNSGMSYAAAFKTFGHKGQLKDRYDGALAWSMAAVPDSAFDYLVRIAKKRFFNEADSLLRVQELKPLTLDKRWKELEDVVKLYDQYKVPEGWLIAGTPEDYDKYLIGVEKGSGQDGKNAATIKALEKNMEGFGNLMQSFSPDPFFNKRVRMSGYMKTKEAGWASFWFRIDGEGSKRTLSFDNMKDGEKNRSIKGTTDWKRYEIVLDVPAEATGASFGVMLGEGGQVWFDNIKFEFVDKTVPLTDIYKKAPRNLDFEK